MQFGELLDVVRTEVERIGKEAVVSQCKVLVRNFLGRHKSHESKDWLCFG